MAGMEIMMELDKSHESEDSWTQEVIRTYKPIIAPYLRPFEFVVNGNFSDIISRETEREILKLDKNGQQELAANLFIQALLDSDQENKWSLFQEEIKRPEHEMVKDILFGASGENLDSLNQLEYAFRAVFRERLVQRLEPVDTANKCFEKELLTKQEYEKVSACSTNHGASHGIVVLLSYIHRARDWYPKFLRIMWQMDQKDLVNYIDPDSYNKFCAQNDDAMEDNDTQVEMMYESGPECFSNNLLTAPDKNTLDDPEVEMNLRFEAEKPYVDLTIINKAGMASNDGRSISTCVEYGNVNYKENLSHLKLNVPSSELDDESNVTDALMPAEPEEIVLIDEPFKLRSYQEELAESACRGKNVIICSPTGSGKTHVALQIISNHMSGSKRNSKAIFLVNQKALAEQQLTLLKQHLGMTYRCVQISGDTVLSIPFEKIVQMNDILVVTAQILLDALENGMVKTIRVFSLLVFDECHHTKDKHPFNCIMLKYLKEKYPNCDKASIVLDGLPQIVALTASVGVGKSKLSEDAVRHIRQLCSNLDIEEICVVEKNKEDLAKWTNTADHAIIPCASRGTDDFKNVVDSIMRQIEGKMQEIYSMDPPMKDLTAQLPSLVKRWSLPYNQWVSKMYKEIAKIKNDDKRRSLESARRHLEIYYNALIINEDCRTKDAFRYLQETIISVEKNQGDNFTDFEKELHEQFEKHKTVLQTAEGSENPKLKTLHSLIHQCFDEHPDSRAIVFVKTRDLASAIETWIKETDGFKSLNPRKMVGTGASAERGGMTQSQQVDVMSCFRDGKHKIIVATSVAQEGLDVTKCNRVIQYDYNTNEIAMVQARGRARAENSTYAVIASSSSTVRNKEEVNLLREKLMNEAIQILRLQMTSDVEGYEKEKTKNQLGSLTTVLLEERTQERRTLVEGEFKLTCERCGELACFVSDLRTVKDSHHVVIDPEFETHIEVKAHPQPISYSGIEKKGKLHCAKCSDDWGIVVKHKGHFYPVIKIQKFCVTDTLGYRKTYDRWKDVNFRVHPLEIDEKTTNIDAKCQDFTDQ